MDKIIDKWIELRDIPPGRIPVLSKAATVYKNVITLYLHTTYEDHIVDKIMDNLTLLAKDPYTPITEKLVCIIELSRSLQEIIEDCVDGDYFEEATVLHNLKIKLFHNEPGT